METFFRAEAGPALLVHSVLVAGRTHRLEDVRVFLPQSPGEIKCHNVDLYGGFWWVITARGEPAD